MYDNRKVKLEIIEEFKKRFEEATDAEEMGIIRDEFFNLPYGEERLENGWDIVCGCEPLISGRPQLDKYVIPMDEIVRLFQNGTRICILSRKFQIEANTLKHRIKRFIKTGV